jgi:hypothetical protein
LSADAASVSTDLLIGGEHDVIAPGYPIKHNAKVFVRIHTESSTFTNVLAACAAMAGATSREFVIQVDADRGKQLDLGAGAGNIGEGGVGDVFSFSDNPNIARGYHFRRITCSVR